MGGGASKDRGRLLEELAEKERRLKELEASHQSWQHTAGAVNVERNEPNQLHSPPSPPRSTSQQPVFLQQDQTLRKLFSDFAIDDSHWWGKDDLNSFISALSSGQIDWISADLNAQRKLKTTLEQKLGTTGRIKFEDFSAAMQPLEQEKNEEEKARMERYFLSIGIHDILVQAAMDNGIGTVEALRNCSADIIGLMVHGAAPRVASAIKKGLQLAQDEDEREQQMFQSLQEQYQKQMKIQQLLLSKNQNSVLIDVSGEGEAWGLTGLMDAEDALQLRKDLWDAAGQPAANEKKPHLAAEDKATWTWDNLNTFRPEKAKEREAVRSELVALNGLQRYAGKGYERRVHSAFNLLKLSSCHNILPFVEHLCAQDKHELTHSNGKRVVFDLDAAVFESGNAFNSRPAMLRLKKMLAYPRLIWAFTLLDADADGRITRADVVDGNEILTLIRIDVHWLLSEMGAGDGEGAEGAGSLTRRRFLELVTAKRKFLELFASPINSVTLPPEARVKAAIPVDAAFYGFSYPLTSTLRMELVRLSAATSDDEAAIALSLTLPLAMQEVKLDAVKEAVARACGLQVQAVTVTSHEPIQMPSWTLDADKKGLEGVRLELRLAVADHAASERRHLLDTLGGSAGRVGWLRDFGLDRFSAQTNFDRLRAEWGEGAGAEPMEWEDPFVCWIAVGGFVYFDHKYDIVAINALCAREVHHNTAALYLGRPALLPPMAIDPLSQGKRWVAVALERLKQQGFTHFAWVTPSEFLGDSIFTRSGGFAYLHRDAAKSMFFPVARKAALNPAHATAPDLRFLNTEQHRPLPYDAPLHIEELLDFEQGEDDDTGGDHRSERYIAELAAEQAVFADGRGAVLGIKKAIGATEQDVATWAGRPDAGLEAMRREVEESGNEEDVRNLRYVLDEPASEEKVIGNDGRAVTRDKGHGGLRLQDFCREKAAELAELKACEVAALRLYTTSTFKRINNPLRQHDKSPPLKATTFFIYEGLKKLRAVHVQSSSKFEPRYLWRGLRDRVVNPTFLRSGGTEVACMSTSRDLSVVASYALSRTPLLFRIKVTSPMDMGADIAWLSAFPTEKEVLYPPLTFLKPMFTQKIKGVPDGTVITVQPSFPT